MDGEKNTSEDPIGLSKEDLEALFEGVFNQQAGSHEKSTQNTPQNTPFSEASFEAAETENALEEFKESQAGKTKPGAADRRAKSSLRFKYEAEVSSVIKTHGELEDIRRNLGLSKRKISQLLMVDPSAWTRWTKPKGEAPPHIYRALEWFLLLQEKHPQYKASLWLNAVATPQMPPKEIESLKQQLLSWAQEEMRPQAPLAKGEIPLKSSEDAQDRRILTQFEKRERFLKAIIFALICALVVSFFI